MPEPKYLFGHDVGEVRRLELQSRLFAPGTERVLRAAGLAPGMSVLDVGTGAGDAAMLAAEMVGPSGSVLGIDREASVLERARIRYEAAALDGLPPERTFDAVIERYVLQHQPDPGAFVRQMALHVRQGGILVCMAPGLASAAGGQPWSSPAAPLYDGARDLCLAAMRLGGVSMSIWLEFIHLFHEAGLPPPTLLRDELIGGPDSPLIEHVCLTLRSVLPSLQKRGVTSAADVDIDTLEARMRAEVLGLHSQLWSPANLVGAWGRAV